VRWLYLAAVWLHVLSAMAWVGGMVSFVIVVMPVVRRLHAPLQAPFVDEAGRRFAWLTAASLAMLLATGLASLAARGVAPADLMRADWWRTSFGTILVAKLVLVTVASTLCWWHARRSSAAHARALGRLTALVAMAVVLLAVALARAI
jgi:uncharacterized membrane protein